MTAVARTEYRLWCDFPQCPARYGPMAKSRALVRRLAVVDGWTHVRSGSGRKHDADYCPLHKPQGGC